MKYLLILTIFLVGCSSNPPMQPVTVYEKIPITCNVKKPDGIVPLSVDLQTVQDVEGEWWIAIDAQNYLNLARNNQEILRYIKDLQAYSTVLNNCIEDSKKGAN